MRLHELTVTAFGPFVETVHVDFDELAAGGLFLLTGDTGAGKTSVLDAVCFALYGEVPGERHAARHLRSDHADAAAEPRVVLRVGIGSRELRLTRSPAWDRPKRRGSGTTRVQAHVVVEEERSGEWVALTNRLDEAGHLVTDLLGMTCAQFTQVAMLPQGRFQALLRASSSERHAVLQRLFRTRRYEDVERWLVERRVELRRRSQACHDRAAGVVHRIREAADAECPGDPQDLEPLVQDGALDAWVASLSRDACDREAVLGAELADVSERLDLSRSALAAAQDAAEARARGERARQALRALDESADDEAGLAAALDDHRRAAVVLPATIRTEQAEQAMDRSSAAAAQSAARVADLLGVAPAEVTPDLLARTASRTGESRAVAESWLPRERELQDVRSRVRLLTAQVEGLETRVAAARDELGRTVESRNDLLPLLDRARGLADQRADRERVLESAAAGLAAAARVADLEARVAERRAMLEAAVQRAQDLRERHLDLREQRISGMAAELASSLAVGCSCPVCGSHDHPSPATATARVSRADEEAARQRHETADFERQAVREALSALESQLDRAREESARLDEAHWQRTHDAAATAVEESLAAARRREELEAQRLEHDRTEARLTAALAADRATLEGRRQQVQEVEQRQDLLGAELAGLLAAHPGTTSVAALVEAQTECLRLLEAALERSTAHERATHELARARALAEEAATGAGFDSLADAVAAVLPAGEAARHAQLLEERRSARASATGVLEEPAVVAALAVPAPDLSTMRRAVVRTEAERDTVHAAHRQATTRLSRLTALREELDRELAGWEPVRRRHAVVAGLAALVEGKSVDNQLKMRLSAYVLSERLRQVVDAANERLGAMTDQRYTLEQADEKGAGEQRGGLSLRVRDEWSGKQRDPATLSGGETFLVSLALALGLADTVSHEAGGTQLDTLFIDEGFGALDAATLDGVMDTLDSLRDGGRVVGLVSHVAELRNRIPTQLEVRKARRGSTLSATLAAG